MTQEEQNIKQKIENISDFDLYFDDSDLWNRLEEKLDKKEAKKPSFIWLWSAAACLILGVFLFINFREKPVQQSLVLEKSPTQPSLTGSDRRFGTLKVPNSIEKKYLITQNQNSQTNFYKTQHIDSQLVTDENNQKNLNFELSKLNPKTKIDSLEFNKKAIAYEPKFKVEKVTIVDFPLIPDGLMVRENLAKRVFRQVKNFNTEGKIDWRELNIEPRNVWAYLERNFKYDTTTISNKKHSKL